MVKLTNDIQNGIMRVARGQNIFTGDPVLSETTRPVMIHDTLAYLAGYKLH